MNMARRGEKAGGAGTKANKTFRQRFAALHRICMMITLAKFSANDRAQIFGNALSQGGHAGPVLAGGIRPGALTFRPQQIARVLETLSPLSR